MPVEISAAKEMWENRKREPDHSEEAPVNVKQEENLGYVILGSLQEGNLPKPLLILC